MINSKPVIDLSITEGHIVLYCKGHYRVEGVDWIQGLRRLKAAFCGCNADENSFSDKYLADTLFEIIAKTKSKEGIENFISSLHRELCWSFCFKDREYTAIEKLIYRYMANI